MKKCTCIILSGGQSTRMGTDKAFVMYQGQYMIKHALTLFGSQCDEILISGNAPALSQFGVQVVADTLSQCGPLAGIYSACKVARNEVCFVVPCDVPHITATLFETMYEQLEDYDAVIPRLANGYIEPLVACIKTSVEQAIFPYLQSGQYAAHDFLKTIRVRYFDVTDESLFRNINTLADIV